jgi:hypothetical protein
MKKRVLVLAGIVIISMSELTDLALSISKDSQWTPYVLSWNQKLTVTRNKKKITKKAEPISICTSPKGKTSITLQR